MERDRLTAKQERFVLEYLVSLNATQAAILAGYSKKTANVTGPQNLVKPSIRARIDAELQRIKSAKIADAEEVLQLLTQAARGEIEEDVVITYPDGGYKIKQKKLPARDKVRAMELLGKRYALFTDNMVTREEAPRIVDDVHE